ncbi:nuclear mRNA export, poly(A)+RNA binding protein, partial [Lunasporangiospora selenospora]
MFGRNASTGVSGNEQSGLFTAAGRDRLGPDNTHRGGRNGGGPVRDGSRRRGGSTGSGRRPGGLRGTSSVLPDVRRVRSSDQDGDMDMGGEKKKNFSPYQRPGRGPRSSTNSSPGTTTSGNFVVFVTGPGIGTDASLFDFLNRKTSPVKLNVSNLIIKTTGDFSAMEESTDSASRSAATTSSGTIDSIRSFIRSRYSNGFLNLENMAADEILRSASIYPPGRRTGRSDVGPVMMKVAAELFPETTTISFNSNSLRSLQPISSVAQFFPNIQNLSFKNNEIRDYKDLEYLSGNKKLPNLRELILLENPLRDRILSKEKDDISYRSMVTKLFPSIQMLDQSPVAPKISFGLGDIVKEAAEKSALPVSIRGNFFDSPGTQAMAFEFLTRQG